MILAAIMCGRVDTTKIVVNELHQSGRHFHFGRRGARLRRRGIDRKSGGGLSCRLGGSLCRWRQDCGRMGRIPRLRLGRLPPQPSQLVAWTRCGSSRSAHREQRTGIPARRSTFARLFVAGLRTGAAGCAGVFGAMRSMTPISFRTSCWKRESLSSMALRQASSLSPSGSSCSPGMAAFTGPG